MVLKSALLLAFLSFAAQGQDLITITLDGKEFELKPGAKVPFVVDGVVYMPPIFLEKKPPTYPKKALRKRVEGRVVLQATLLEKGKMSQIEIVESPDQFGKSFERSVIRAVRKWRFKPGTVNGKPSKARMSLVINFVLKRS